LEVATCERCDERALRGVASPFEWFNRRAFGPPPATTIEPWQGRLMRVCASCAGDLQAMREAAAPARPQGVEQGREPARELPWWARERGEEAPREVEGVEGHAEAERVRGAR
jgi:hypothetical protein